MTETVIPMLAQLRDEVLSGTRRTAWRPGHRDYREGPVTIQFLAQSKSLGLTYDIAIPPVDVWLTKVEHTQATGRYRIFQQFLIAQSQAPNTGNDITFLEWVLVQ